MLVKRDDNALLAEAEHWVRECEEAKRSQLSAACWVLGWFGLMALALWMLHFA